MEKQREQRQALVANKDVMAAILKTLKNLAQYKGALFYVLFWGLIIFISVITATQKLDGINFNPINGYWQNYNHVRRFIDGQAPFADFSVYLGYGPLLTLSLPQLFLDDSFAVNLIITYATVYVCFALFWFAISKLILKDFYASAFFTLSIWYLNLLRPGFSSLMGETIMRGFNRGISPGNSALIIRLAIVPLILLFLPRFFENRFSTLKYFNLKSEIVVAIIAGVSIVWSNDGGISWFLAFSFLYALLQLKHKGFTYRLLKSAGLYAGVSLLSLFTFLLLITYGSPLTWFYRTLGVSSYQRWYFMHLKPSSLRDFNLNFHTAFIMALLTFYIYKFIKTTKDDHNHLKYFWLSCVLFAFFIQTTLYFFSNGSIANNDIMYLSAFIIIVSYALYTLKRVLTNQKWFKNGLLTSMTLILIISIYNQHFTQGSRMRGEAYIEVLGGYLNNPSPILLNYVVDRIGSDKIFSTYAGAVEAMTNQFQPTGIDYIIHVLGDYYREHYLEVFSSSEHQYVTTISRKFSHWGEWAIQANWFFHRKLFHEYMPVFTSDTQVFWERRMVQTITPSVVTVNIIRIAENQMEIMINTDADINGTADVRFGYSVNIERLFRNLDFASSATWTDTQNDEIYPDTKVNNTSGIRPSQSLFVDYKPITIVEGYGRAVITAAPVDNVLLNIYFADIYVILPQPFNYAATSNLTDENWENGIHRTHESRFIVDSYRNFNIAIENASFIRVGEYEFEIVGRCYNGMYHTIHIDGDASILAFPSIFELVP